MGITVKIGSLVVPKGMRAKLAEVMTNEVAPVIGEFLVKQIAFTHDVQGRTEDDQYGVWPPRKVPTSGIVVFSERGDLKRAIRQMLKDKKRNQLKSNYAVNQQTIAGKDMTGVGRYGRSGSFTHKQLEGAILALGQEKSNKKKRAVLQKEVRDELSKGEGASVDRLAELRSVLKSTPRAITSLKSARDSMKYRPRPVLFQTGTLRDSWNWKVSTEKNSTVIYIGTSVQYAAVHFDGSPKRNIPARKEFVLTKKDDAQMGEIIRDVVSSNFRNAFGGRRS